MNDFKFKVKTCIHRLQKHSVRSKNLLSLNSAEKFLPAFTNMKDLFCQPWKLSDENFLYKNNLTTQRKGSLFGKKSHNSANRVCSEAQADPLINVLILKTEGRLSSSSITERERIANLIFTESLMIVMIDLKTIEKVSHQGEYYPKNNNRQNNVRNLTQLEISPFSLLKTLHQMPYL